MCVCACDGRADENVKVLALVARGGVVKVPDGELRRFLGHLGQSAVCIVLCVCVCVRVCVGGCVCVCARVCV